MTVLDVSDDFLLYVICYYPDECGKCSYEDAAIDSRKVVGSYSCFRIYNRIT